jgi:hypothetical protein
MAWWRGNACREGTANTLCTVPRGINATQWCLLNYDKLDCYEIRESAQSIAEKWLLTFYWFNAGWAFLVIILVCQVSHAC